MSDPINSVQGNTRSAQKRATSSREDARGVWSGNIYNFFIPLTLLIVGITIASMDISIYWNYVCAIALIALGSNLNLDGIKAGNKLWDWPKYIKALGWMVLTVSLFGSGVGKWIEHLVVEVDTSASCAADPTDPVCKEAKKKEVAERQRELAARMKARAQRSAPAKPEAIQSPRCDSKFAPRNGCQKITFRNGGTYLIVDVPKGTCPIPHSFSLANVKHVRADVYRASSKVPGAVTVHFFNIKIGEKYGNFTC
jgi:hypothetical protein